MNAYEEMQNFVRVVEAGSISKAAEQLGLAKSGVSRRLAELEKRLGVLLLTRTTRRSSLTEAGRTYYEGAVRLLSDVAELDTLVAVSEASLEGRLRLAAPLSFGLAHLTPAIEAFARTHPGVLVDLDFSDRQIDLVESGGKVVQETVAQLGELDAEGEIDLGTMLFHRGYPDDAIVFPTLAGTRLDVPIAVPGNQLLAGFRLFTQVFAFGAGGSLHDSNGFGLTVF